MSVMEESGMLRKMIKSVVNEAVEKATRDCFRVYKAVITTVPDGSACGVRLVGENTIMSLPYSSKITGVSVGDIVWIASIYGSMHNAIVWETADFK